MTISKPWDWQKGTDPIWKDPTEESYYYAQRWQKAGYKELLDFGCGLGRHAIFFAKQGFQVSAFDLAEGAVDSLREWAQAEKLTVDVRQADMLHLPYPDNRFDCIFSYNVISHTDSKGARQIMGEIRRVLRPGGEIFLTLCSKETWSFKDAGFPKIDESTVIRLVEGPEMGVPHFFVNLEEIAPLMEGFELLKIRDINDCFPHNGSGGVHYFITARKPADAAER